MNPFGRTFSEGSRRWSIRFGDLLTSHRFYEDGFLYGSFKGIDVVTLSFRGELLLQEMPWSLSLRHGVNVDIDGLWVTDVRFDDEVSELRNGSGVRHLRQLPDILFAVENAN